LTPAGHGILSWPLRWLEPMERCGQCPQ
jgi:hypothetical protein